MLRAEPGFRESYGSCLSLVAVSILYRIDYNRNRISGQLPFVSTALNSDIDPFECQPRRAPAINAGSTSSLSAIIHVAGIILQHPLYMPGLRNTPYVLRSACPFGQTLTRRPSSRSLSAPLP